MGGEGRRRVLDHQVNPPLILRKGSHVRLKDPFFALLVAAAANAVAAVLLAIMNTMLLLDSMGVI